MQYILKNYKIHGTVSGETNSGRKSKLNQRLCRSLMREINSNPFASSEKIAQELNERCKNVISARSVRRYLTDFGFSSYRARRKPLLSYAHKSKRLEWCLKYSEEPIEFWEKVIFSDESRICLMSSDKPPMVRRPKNHSLDEKYLIPTIKHPIGLMVWGCISVNGVGELEIINGTMNLKAYCDLLKKNLKRSSGKMNIEEFIFQDDNAPCHRYTLVNKWTEDNKVKKLHFLPTQSPDRNPIENLWHLLKKKIALYKPKNKNELIKFTKKV